MSTDDLLPPALVAARVREDRPQTLADVSTEQERIGVLLHAFGIFCVNENNAIGMILCIQDAIEQGERGLVDQLYGFTIPYTPNSLLVRALLDSDLTEFRWDDATQQQRTWLYKCCGAEIQDGHLAGCIMLRKEG